MEVRWSGFETSRQASTGNNDECQATNNPGTVPCRIGSREKKIDGVLV